MTGKRCPTFAKHVFPILTGVDVFFAISGYLITALVMRDVEAGRFSLAEFYDRRIRRIFPALVLVLFKVITSISLVLLDK